MPTPRPPLDPRPTSLWMTTPRQTPAIAIVNLSIRYKVTTPAMSPPIGSYIFMVCALRPPPANYCRANLSLFQSSSLLLSTLLLSPLLLLLLLSPLLLLLLLLPPLPLLLPAASTAAASCCCCC